MPIERMSSDQYNNLNARHKGWRTDSNGVLKREVKVKTDPHAKAKERAATIRRVAAQAHMQPRDEVRRMLGFVLPTWPPRLSEYTNNSRGGGRHKFAFTESWMKSAVDLIRSAMGATLAESKLYRVTYTFEGHVNNKDGTARRLDIGNMEKALSDALSEAIGIDDSRFRPITLDARQADVESTVITIEVA